MYVQRRPFRPHFFFSAIDASLQWSVACRARESLKSVSCCGRARRSRVGTKRAFLHEFFEDRVAHFRAALGEAVELEGDTYAEQNSAGLAE